MSIHRPSRRQPILRDEIAVVTEAVADRTAKEERAIELLTGLVPENSRAVVFVTSRRLAEELAATVSRRTDLVAAPFHAGLPAEVRLETYERFREGALSVLCATKAFGMGMDIDNIHLVIHFGPPSSLEDYIQEIGRAARNHSSLERAGLDKATAYLLYEPGDFPRMQDRLKNGFLSSVDLGELHGALVAEWKRAGESEGQILSVQPDRLAARLRSGTCTSNQVREGLYWLEQMERIRLGFYGPAQIEVELDLEQAEKAARLLSFDVKNLLQYLRDNQGQPSQATVLFSAQDAVRALGLPTQNALFSLLADLVRKKVVRYRRSLLLPLAPGRAQEARARMTDMRWPLIEAVSAVLMDIRTGLEDLDFDGWKCRPGQLEEQFATVANTHFQAGEFTWIDPGEREELGQRERQSFPRRVPAVLQLLRGLQIVWVRQEIGPEGLVRYLVPRRRFWEQWLEALPTLLRVTLRSIVNQEQTREPSEAEDDAVDAQSLLLAVEEVAQRHELSFGISHLETILRFLRNLRYLGKSDVFVPMALEVQVLDPSPVELGDSGRDARVLHAFEEQKQLRTLRLAALQAIPSLSSDREQLRTFVEQRYFRASSAEELMAILEEHLPAGNEILSQFREEALKELLDGNPAEKKPGLSPQQRAVYDAPLDQHLMVVAGPGAGKTHTLLARLVRLVHCEDVRAGDILVLAFTRAVVSELRYRLQTLLGRLGYGTLARGIRVTTFHSFVRATLREFDPSGGELTLDGTDWFEAFEKRLLGNRALRRAVASGYRYVFVDEFQDVRGARYRLLEHLAAGRQTYLLVVGDDDQSIYDYERGADEGDAIDYFRDFKSRFNPLPFDLTLNYRSARAIVDFSQGIVADLAGRLKANHVLEAVRPAQGVAEWRAAEARLTDLVREARYHLETATERRSQHTTVAVLARTNADVYKTRAHLQSELGDDFSLLIQGEESRFVDRRDVAEVIDRLREAPPTGDLTPARLLDLICYQLASPRIKNWLCGQRPEQHELCYLAEEFVDGADRQVSALDFIEYVREMSQNGNYLRVVARRQAAAADSKGRVLLSTIHKVKGIEFPAVILLDSDNKVDSDEIVQELRVMYVGMTRAEDVLMAVQGEREAKLLRGQPFLAQDGQSESLAVAPSLKDVFISYFGANLWRMNRLSGILHGTSLTLRRTETGFRIHLADRTNNYIGLLAQPNWSEREPNLARRLQTRFRNCDTFTGLEVIGIYRRMADWDRKTEDKRPPGRSFYDSLCPEAKEQGWYYVVEIGGLVRPG